MDKPPGQGKGKRNPRLGSLMQARAVLSRLAVSHQCHLGLRPLSLALPTATASLKQE